MVEKVRDKLMIGNKFHNWGILWKYELDCQSDQWLALKVWTATLLHPWSKVMIMAWLYADTQSNRPMELILVTFYLFFY